MSKEGLQSYPLAFPFGSQIRKSFIPTVHAVMNIFPFAFYSDSFALKLSSKSHVNQPRNVLSKAFGYVCSIKISNSSETVELAI